MNRSAMNKGEPPSARSSALPSLFRIGKDSHGHWVVQDQVGLRGGVFVDRAEALKFAMFENGNRPQAVIMVPEGLELEMNNRRYQTAHADVGNQISSRQLA
jgi:hypothetical protein